MPRGEWNTQGSEGTRRSKKEILRRVQSKRWKGTRCTAGKGWIGNQGKAIVRSNAWMKKDGIKNSERKIRSCYTV